MSDLVDRLREARLPAPEVRRSIREAVGATLEDLARELDVTQSCVSRWESGVRTPSLVQRLAYRRLLDQLRELSEEPLLEQLEARRGVQRDPA